MCVFRPQRFDDSLKKCCITRAKTVKSGGIIEEGITHVGEGVHIIFPHFCNVRIGSGVIEDIFAAPGLTIFVIDVLLIGK